ncbi:MULTISPECIES: hypothetical protein [Pseudomonadota]|uniref:hypothetical protein n=1 Tax=Pseudomonadota TaxID=1224 RepID=UPI0026275E24|nr:MULTISPECIES: hypothetical protein [Pseudomonadota]
MKYLNFGVWFLFVVTVLVITGGSIHALFDNIAPAFNISGNRATAGGYSMEVLVSFITFIMVLWRVIWAVEVTHSLSSAAKLLRTRTAILSMGISGLVGMVCVNRFFWWTKHMFTSQAYNYSEYSGAANSVIVSILMCIVVYALHADPEVEGSIENDLPVGKRQNLFPKGTIIAGSIWLAGVISFLAGSMLYSPRF